MNYFVTLEHFHLCFCPPLLPCSPNTWCCRLRKGSKQTNKNTNLFSMCPPWATVHGTQLIITSSLFRLLRVRVTLEILWFQCERSSKMQDIRAGDYKRTSASLPLLPIKWCYTAESQSHSDQQAQNTHHSLQNLHLGHRMSLTVTVLLFTKLSCLTLCIHIYIKWCKRRTDCSTQQK